MICKSKQIWVTFQKEGIHCFPAAKEDPKYATGKWDDVSYLGFPHRHIFHFRVSIDVHHNDREIEFIQFKRWLERVISGGAGAVGEGKLGSNANISSDTNRLLNLNNKSVEMISAELARIIGEKYPQRSVTIEVSEDGENGCTCVYHPSQWEDS